MSETFKGIEYHSKVCVLSWISEVFVIGRNKDKSLITQNLSSSVKFSLFDFCKIVEENIENISTAFRTSPRIYLINT